MIPAGTLSPLFWQIAIIVGLGIAIWAKTSRATEFQKRLVTTCFLLVINTVPWVVMRLIDTWTIVLIDGIIIVGGLVSLTRFRLYAAVFFIGFGVAWFLLTLVVPSITDPNSWCPSRHVVAGICQAS